MAKEKTGMNRKEYLQELTGWRAQYQRANLSLEHALVFLKTGGGCLAAGFGETSLKSRFLEEQELKRRFPIVWKIFAGNSGARVCIRIYTHYCAQAARLMRTIPPVLDDMAQIVGVRARVFRTSESGRICRELAKSRACLIHASEPERCGAIAAGGSLGQAFAAALVLEKSARVFLQGRYLGGAKPLPYGEALIMHADYEFIYSRLDRSKDGREPSAICRPMSERERRLREEMAALGKRMVRDNLVQGTWGNISVRLDDLHMLCTPSGLNYDSLTPEDLVRVNLDTLEYEGALKPTSEKAFHAGLLKKHADIHCVIHTHPFAGSVFAAAHCPVRPIGEEEREKLGGYVAVAAYASPGSKKLAANVIASIKKNRACIMENHGVLVCGGSMEDAYERCRLLERCATKELRRLALQRPSVFNVS